MMIIGIILLVLGTVFCIILAFNLFKIDEVMEGGLVVFSGIALALGMALIWAQPKNNDDDKEYTIECSDYKIINQPQMTITGEDTVVYIKYIIKYKK